MCPACRAARGQETSIRQSSSAVAAGSRTSTACLVSPSGMEGIIVQGNSLTTDLSSAQSREMVEAILVSLTTEASVRKLQTEIKMA